ncbi:phosphatase PAP2 family protein, partial [Patescibacteria group bacterium]|nr:phosphatase PAP2 family protein [Patescibacteria group bacterium]
SVGGSAVCVYILKLLITRPRPTAIPVYIEDSFSFPSGHATVAVALYGFLLYFCVKNIANKLWRWISITALFLVIFLLGFSRIYLGVHYFSDVIGGFLLGGIWLGVGIWFVKSDKNAKFIDILCKK